VNAIEEEKEKLAKYPLYSRISSFLGFWRAQRRTEGSAAKRHWTRSGALALLSNFKDKKSLYRNRSRVLGEMGQRESRSWGETERIYSRGEWGSHSEEEKAGEGPEKVDRAKAWLLSLNFRGLGR